MRCGLPRQAWRAIDEGELNDDRGHRGRVPGDTQLGQVGQVLVGRSATRSSSRRTTTPVKLAAMAAPTCSSLRFQRPSPRADTWRSGRRRRLRARRLCRRRQRVGGHPLGHKADDGSRSGRPRVEAAGAEMSHAPAIPDSTAVRTALWRALHLEVDAPPHVLDDRIGLQLATPIPRLAPAARHERIRHAGCPRVDRGTGPVHQRLVVEQADHGVGQYVLLGAGLDTFAQRRPEIASRITVLEVTTGTSERGSALVDLGFGVREWSRWCR